MSLEATPAVDRDDGVAALQASRCTDCRSLMYPARSVCENCGRAALSVEELPRVGCVWTWTSQSFAPPSPPYYRTEDRASFVPYFVGYVQLGTLLVLARLSPANGRPPRIGETINLTRAALPGFDATLPALPCFEVTT